MPTAYYKTKESVDEYIRLAKDVNGGEHIEELKKFLPLQSSLLELGSGPGTDWEILNKDYQVVGSDNSTEFISRLQTAHPEDQFLELDASSLDTTDRFQGIYSNKVLHHLKDEELLQSIEKQHAILKNEGIICHSFWKGEGSEIFKGLFVNYHTQASLRSFFEPHFEILLLKEYAEFEEGDSLLLIGRRSV